MSDAIRGSATVLSTDYTRYSWFFADVEIDHGDLHEPTPCEVVRTSDGSVHEVSAAIPPWKNPPSNHQLRVLRRDPRTRHLQAGDVVTWYAEPERRFVDGWPLSELFDYVRRVQARDGVLDDALANQLANAGHWSGCAWYDTGREWDGTSYERAMRGLSKQALERGEVVEEAMLLEAVRRVLHTVEDVRRGRMPVQHRYVLRGLDRLDPLTHLGRRDRELARPLAQRLEVLTLEQALRQPGPQTAAAEPSAVALSVRL